MGNLTSLTKGFTHLLGTYSHEICLGAAIGGAVATALLSAQAMPLYLDRVAEYAEEYEVPLGELTLWDKTKISWDIWLPPASMLVTTVSCITAVYLVGAKRYRAAVAAYTVTTEAFDQYRKYIRSEVGDEADKKAVVTAYPEHSMAPKEIGTIFVSEGTYMCYDTLSGRMFESSREDIRAAVNTLNYTLLNDSVVSLNEFYREIGLPTTTLGADLGWCVGEPVEVAFKPRLGERGQPILQFEIIPEPRERYDRLG